MTDRETRRRLLVNRHIAKMSPEEIRRRFAMAHTAPFTIKRRRPAQAEAKNAS